MKKALVRCLAIGSCIFGFPAHAYDMSVANAHVTGIEVSYVPGQLRFSLDAAISSGCPAGTFLSYNGNGADAAAKAANVNAVYSALLTAEATGHSVTVFGTASGCIAEFVYIFST